MNKYIKIKLIELGKKQVDLLDEIRKRGYPGLADTQLSRYINSRERTAQAEAVLDICRQIIDDWENKEERR